MMPAVAVPRKSLKRPLQVMPRDVRDVLTSKKLLAVYRSRPAYQRNDYLSWIKSAKRPETREKRLAQMITELKAGSHYMKMAWPGKR